MGVRYSATESAQLIQALGHNVALANEIIDRLSTGCDRLTGSLEAGELQGAAYTAAGGLFREVIRPAIKKLQEAIDDVEVELTSYRSADEEVAPYGTLDRDQLMEIKRRREEQLALIHEQIEENQAFFRQLGELLSGRWLEHWSETSQLYQIADQIGYQIRDIETKIEKLDRFVLQVSAYFSDSLTVLQLAIQGAVQLSQVQVNGDGSYSTAGLDMSWLTHLQTQKLTNHVLDKEVPLTKVEEERKIIVDSLESAYGLDRETALLLYRLQQAILKKALAEDWSKERVIYEYNRLVASPVYGERATWNGIAGTLRWEKSSELGMALQGYGFSLIEIQKFIEKIDYQQNPQYNKSSKELAHEAVYLAAVTEESWKHQRLVTKNDWTALVAHIISSMGNSMRIGDMDVPTEQYESSFRGDINSGRYGDTDLNSDLDAINMYKVMMADDVTVSSLFLAQANYTQAIQTNDLNRVQTFYENLGQGDIEKGKEFLSSLLEHDTIGGNYIRYDEIDTRLFIGGDRSEHDKSVNDFYDYLERGTKKNVGT